MSESGPDQFVITKEQIRVVLTGLARTADEKYFLNAITTVIDILLAGDRTDELDLLRGQIDE